ncbi:MAG: 30S ribosomal protein S16 [Candidatus Latescibacterota bacterium]|nr:MAG: 30S ribosomal protein S16 [Candidatus Latescibacterota bacterium]
MSVRIRLKRMGSKKKPFYRIIATDSRMPRDGRFLETLGYYNPMTEPPDIQVHEDILFKWFDRGATPSENAESLLRRAGCIQKYGLIKAGVTGEELETKVEAIKNQQEAAAEKKLLKKKDAKSEKAVKKEAAEAEAATTAEEPTAEESKAEAAEAPKSEEPKAEEAKTDEAKPEAVAESPEPSADAEPNEDKAESK